MVEILNIPTAGAGINPGTGIIEINPGIGGSPTAMTNAPDPSPTPAENVATTIVWSDAGGGDSQVNTNNISGFDPFSGEVSFEDGQVLVDPTAPQIADTQAPVTTGTPGALNPGDAATSPAALEQREAEALEAANQAAAAGVPGDDLDVVIEEADTVLQAASGQGPLASWWSGLSPEQQLAVGRMAAAIAGHVAGGEYGGAAQAIQAFDHTVGAEQFIEKSNEVSAKVDGALAGSTVNVNGQEVNWDDLSAETRTQVANQLKSMFMRNPSQARALSQDLLGKDVFRGAPNPLAGFSEEDRAALGTLVPELQAQAVGAVQSNETTVKDIKEGKVKLNQSTAYKLGLDKRNVLTGPNAPGGSNEAAVRRELTISMVDNRSTIDNLVKYVNAGKLERGISGISAWLGSDDAATLKDTEKTVIGLANMLSYARTGAALNEQEQKEILDQYGIKMTDSPAVVRKKTQRLMKDTVETLYSRGYELSPEMLILREKNYDLTDPTVTQMFSGTETTYKDGKYYIKQDGKWFELGE